MVHWIFLKYMAQRFVRLLFDFTCIFVFMISVYSDVNLFKLFPCVSAYFCLPIGGGRRVIKLMGGGLQHMGDLEKQFKMKLWSTKTGRKTLSSFRKSQNHLKNLLGLFSRETRNTAGYFTDFFFFFLKVQFLEKLSK